MDRFPTPRCTPPLPSTGDLISTLIVPAPSQDFLFYYEKYLHLSEHDQKIVYVDWFPSTPRSPLISVSSSSPPKDWDPFVKQTYSAWVNTENGNRKWHLSGHRFPFLFFLSMLTVTKRRTTHSGRRIALGPLTTSRRSATLLCLPAIF